MSENKLPYAEDVNYWKTGTSSPGTWIERVSRLIEGFKGKVYTHAFGKDDQGSGAFMIFFKIGPDNFKIIWPVLPSRSRNEEAARRQAATLLYHDVKAKCLRAAVFGTRSAFFQYLMLPDGRTAEQASVPELAAGIPVALSGYEFPVALRQRD